MAQETTYDNTEQSAHYPHSGQNKSPILIKDHQERREGVWLGQNIQTVEYEVDTRFQVDFTPTFGVLERRLWNERNNRRNRYEEARLLDVSFTPQVRTGWGEMGAQGITRTTSIEDATSGVPAPTAESSTLLSSEVQQLDRAHAARIDIAATSWAPLSSEELHHPDAGGNLKRTISTVSPAAAVLVDDATTIRTYKEAISAEKSRVVLEQAPNGFGVLNSRNMIDSDGFGEDVTRTEQIVEESYTPPAVTYLTLESTLVDLGNNRATYRRRELSAWPTFVDKEEEPETGLEIEVTRTIVDRTSLPTINYGEARTVHSLKNIDKLKALHVKRVIESDILSVTVKEYHNVRYHFPAYLDADDPFAVIQLTAGDSIVGVNRASDHTFSIPCRFEITFHTNKSASLPSVIEPNTTVSEVFQFKPIDIQITTPNYNLTERDVLTDEGTLSFQVGTGSYGFHIPASSPTTTEYFALMGTEVLIADELTKWKFNLWKQVKVYMTLPDLSQGLEGYLTS